MITITLNLVGEDELYTNLVYILPDQFETVMKAAFFQGMDIIVFRDRKEFTGSVLKQLKDTYETVYITVYCRKLVCTWFPFLALRDLVLPMFA